MQKKRYSIGIIFGLCGILVFLLCDFFFDFYKKPNPINGTGIESSGDLYVTNTPQNIYIPTSNTTPNIYIGTDGEDIDNSSQHREIFRKEAMCRIISSQVISSHIIATDVNRCPDLPTSFLIESILKDTANNSFKVFGFMSQDGSSCDWMGSYTTYFLSDNIRTIGGRVYNIVIDKNFYVLEIPPHEEKYDVDFISQLSLPECEPNVQ